MAIQKPLRMAAGPPGGETKPRWELSFAQWKVDKGEMSVRWLEVHAGVRKAIGEFAADGCWLDGDDLENLEQACPDIGEVIGRYLHGDCDDWVLENFQPGDVAVVWNEFDEDIGKVALVHCYIQRGEMFLDVRGETEDEELVEEGFEYGYDHGKVYCSTLEEYKSCIREICGYDDDKWKALSSLDKVIAEADGRKVLGLKDCSKRFDAPSF